MQRRLIRTNPPGTVGPAVAIGLTLGLAAGFILGEFFAGNPPARLRRAWARLQRDEEAESPGALTERLLQQLDDALGPDGQSVELLPIGRDAIEVSGWVSSRTARTRALRITRDALGPRIRLVDSLLVWGEDDQPVTSPGATPDREPA